MIQSHSSRALCDLRVGKEVYTDLCHGGLGNWQVLQVNIWLLAGLLDYLAGRACLAVCEDIFLHIGPIGMTSQGVVDLRGGYMAKGGVYLIPNLIFDVGVPFLCVGNAELHLMLLGVVQGAIVGSGA